MMIKKTMFILAVVAVLLLTVGTASAVTYPTVDVTVDSSTGHFPLTVTYTAHTTGFTPFSYEWDFGDASGSTKYAPTTTATHTYMAPGQYEVKLIVTDFGHGGTNWLSVTKTLVTVTNPPPGVSIATSTPIVHLGERAYFTSEVTGGGITAYFWDFGDGHGVPPSGAPDSIIPDTGIVYENTGEYDVILAVYNDGGHTVSNSVHVSVIPPIPVAEFTGAPVLGQVPLAVQFFDQTPGVMEISAWKWDFGDGTPKSNQQNPLHAYGAVGIYDVSLKVTNAAGVNTTLKAGFVNVTEGNPFTCPEPETIYINTTEYLPAEPVVSNIGIFRPSSGKWALDTDFNSVVDSQFFLLAGGQQLTGDFNGDGFTDAAEFNPPRGTWHIDFNYDGNQDASVKFGQAGDIPVAGDWNADGTTDIGIFRPTTGNWVLASDLSGTVYKRIHFGMNGDLPVIGHWGFP